jgi:kynurenine formamidase
MSVKPGDIYSHEDRRTEPGTTTMTLDQAPKIQPGKVVRIETLFICDETTAAKTLALGFEKAGRSYLVQKEALAVGVNGLALAAPLILAEGEKPIAVVTSPSANDVITFIARGVYL